MDKEDFLKIILRALKELKKYLNFEETKLLRLVQKIINALDDSILNSIKDVPGHEIEHTVRVFALATYLGKKLGADLNIIAPCSLLHDVARLLDPKIENHSLKSAELAEKILVEKNVFDHKMIRDIVNCIREHSFSANIKPTTLESMIVQDADKLDALGYIGVARVFAFGGLLGRPISDIFRGGLGDSSHGHFYSKILKLDKLLNTDEAKKIASKKIAKVRGFIEEFEKEFTSFGLCDVK